RIKPGKVERTLVRDSVRTFRDQFVGDLAVQHALVGESGVQQFTLESIVYLKQPSPHAQETPLVQRLIDIKIRPEALQKFPLLGRQEIKAGIEFLLMTEVPEQLLRRNHVLVDFIEVTQKHFPPEVKVLKAVDPLGIRFLRTAVHY